MKPSILEAVVILSALLTGCSAFEDLHYVPSSSNPDLKPCMPPPDLAPSKPACRAAKGLSGTVLQCVDFDKVQSLSDPVLGGWNFNTYQQNCWQIANNFLQVVDVANFSNNCGFTLPPLDAKYNSATLSIISKWQLNDPQQQASVYVDLDTSSRLLNQATGTRALHQIALSIDKANWPSSGYAFILKFSSVGKFALQGWQIDSIAVTASQ